MNKIILIFTGFFYLCFSSSFKKQDDGLDEAKLNFKKMYPYATEVKWEVDNHNNYEAKFEWKGKKFRADFNSKGKWIETENSIKWEELPKAVKKAVKQKYDKDDIAEIEHVNHYRKGFFYDVEIKDKGKNIDLEYDAQGKRWN